MAIQDRIVITGVGLTSPNGDNLEQYRKNLLAGVSGVQDFETRYMGKLIAGVCHYDPLKYQKKKDVRRGTRAGSIAIYCSHEAIADSGIDFSSADKSRVGVFLGITEHGNVETENEVYNISLKGYDTAFWTHHHNPRTVANNPAGEVTLSMGISGPHYTVGAACAAGNAGLISGVQMLRLGEVDVALAGGVSEAIHTFGIFASFKAQGALATHEIAAKASRPYDLDRNGIVVSEGGCVYVLERYEDARKRGAKIYGEIAGYAMNSDASDFVLPLPQRQVECMRLALARAGITPAEVDIVNTHATATRLGDQQESQAVREVFNETPTTYINNTKSFIGHAMGAAAALELAGNLPAFQDLVVHPTINVDHLDPECAIPNLVMNEPRKIQKVDYILNNSAGMLGINAVVVVKRV
ncbi:MAG: beta-ketoacyl-[acyl-carrier-protein] synthase family protein [Candidatus Wallbacteria bacterium]|nr:beta-ketoacyl-[acyl-carrier-protein] synthase family protein [Candidatus Wallbacteria bacterium]